MRNCPRRLTKLKLDSILARRFVQLQLFVLITILLNALLQNDISATLWKTVHRAYVRRSLVEGEVVNSTADKGLAMNDDHHDTAMLEIPIVVIFLHIHKCGGKAFLDMMRSIPGQHIPLDHGLIWCPSSPNQTSQRKIRLFVPKSIVHPVLDLAGGHPVPVPRQDQLHPRRQPAMARC